LRVDAWNPVQLFVVLGMNRFNVRFETDLSSSWLAIWTHAVWQSVTTLASAIE
jgi:hypothetical protein